MKHAPHSLISGWEAQTIFSAFVEILTSHMKIIEESETALIWGFCSSPEYQTEAIGGCQLFVSWRYDLSKYVIFLIFGDFQHFHQLWQVISPRYKELAAPYCLCLILQASTTKASNKSCFALFYYFHLTCQNFNKCWKSPKWGKLHILTSYSSDMQRADSLLLPTFDTPS